MLGGAWCGVWGVSGSVLKRLKPITRNRFETLPQRGLHGSCIRFPSSSRNQPNLESPARLATWNSGVSGRLMREADSGVVMRGIVEGIRGIEVWIVRGCWVRLGVVFGVFLVPS